MRRPHTKVQVFLHWLLLVEVLTLAVTGIMLHRPFLHAPRGLEVFAHLSVGYVMLSTVGLRVYWLVPGESAAWRERLGEARRDGLLSQSRYIIYVLLWLSLGALVLTGLSLRFPSAGLLSGTIHSLGGMVGVRTTHYLLMWVFASVLLVHTYQPLLHGRDTFLSIFLVSRNARKDIEDDQRPAAARGRPA